MIRKPSIATTFRPILLSILVSLLSVAAIAQTDNARKAQALTGEAMNLVRERRPDAYEAAIAKLAEARRLYESEKLFIEAAETMFVASVATEGLGQTGNALSILEEIYSTIEKLSGTIPDNDTQNLSRALYLAAASRNNAGKILASRGEFEKALKYLRDSADSFKVLGRKTEEFQSYTFIGKTFDDAGRKVEAVAAYKQALEIAKTTNDEANQAILLNHIGKLYFDLQEYSRAIEHFNLALPLRRKLNDRIGEGQTLANLGVNYMHIGEFQRALENLNAALPLRRLGTDRAGEAITLNNLGMLYVNLNEPAKALDFFTQAGLIFKAAGDASGEATALSNIGYLHSERGDNAKAAEYFEKVLAVRRQIKDRAGEALALNNLGSVYLKQREAKKGIDSLNRSLAIAREIGDRKNEAIALVNLGNIDFELGRVDKNANYHREAIGNFQQSLTLFKAVGDKLSEADTLARLMRCYERLKVLSPAADPKDLHLAVLYGKMAALIYQRTRQSIRQIDRQDQKSFLKRVEDDYRTLADILIRTQRLPEAQQVLNAFKDQQLFDLEPVKGELATLSLDSGEYDFVAAYEDLGSRIGRIAQQSSEARRLADTPIPIAAQAAQLKKLDDEFLKVAVAFSVLLANGESNFESSVRNARGKFASVPDTVAMQSVLKEISLRTNQKAVAVYQLAGTEHFHLLMVSEEGIKSVSTPIDTAALQKQALKYWGLLRTDKYDTTKLGKELYDAVFKPLETQLPKGTQTIVWSLDGNLRYVPMAALFDGTQYLVERFNHVMFTRADKERMARPVQADWTAVGFGSTKAQTVDLLGDKISFAALPGVSEEMRVLFRSTDDKEGFFTGDALLDARFTKDSMLAALKQKRPVVHVASHFSFRPGDEQRSFLLLGDGGAFTLDEIKRHPNMFGGVDLLTLSACNTGAQQADANGREVDAFFELAQRLGANSVMATLWPVADNSTPWLMREFYSGKVDGKLTKAESLRRAQLALLEGESKIASSARREAGPIADVIVVTADGKRDTNTRADDFVVSSSQAPLYKKDPQRPFAHPFYWSPFILIGNWK